MYQREYHVRSFVLGYAVMYTSHMGTRVVKIFELEKEAEKLVKKLNEKY